MIGKKGVFNTTMYQISWLFKGPFILVVLIILVGVFNNFYNRDYDVRELERSVIEDRIRFCIHEFDIGGLNKCFVEVNRHAFKLTLVSGGEKVGEKNGKSFVSNDELFVHKPLCIFKNRFRCGESSFNLDGVEYKLELMIERQNV